MTRRETTTANANTNTNATATAQQQAQAQQQDAKAIEVVEAENVETEENNTISATITKVMLPQGTDERITFVLNKEFTTIDFSTGEEKTTNMFGLNIYAVVNQVGQYVPEIQLADTLAMGKCVNPQIIALALTNAEIVVKREEHEQGEKRKNSNELYARDCITSEIIKVKTNIKPIFAQMLMQVATIAPAIVKTAAVPNPFGM
mgnify:CR=1 FL=1